MTNGVISNLLQQIIADLRARGVSIPLIGLGGAQGSGKTHHARAFAHAHPRVAHFSLDDIYLTRAERRKLAETTPLLATRGPPGTHNLALGLRTIERLRRTKDSDATPIPAFDKARDDREIETLWPRFTGRPDAILFDGWCVGATSVPDGPPLNALEANEDADASWRRETARALAAYQPFFASFDEIVYLQAPNFEIVRRWRGEQEENMLGRPMTEAENTAMDRFIMHYERITRSMLAGGHMAGWIVRLDEDRNVLSVERR